MQFRPDHAFPAGHFVGGLLEDRQIDRSDFLRCMGMTDEGLGDLLEGRSGVNPALALALERVLNVGAHYWLSLEAQYQEHMARRAEVPRLLAGEGWSRGFPYREMAAFQWVRPASEPGERVERLLRFFGVAGVAEWEAAYTGRLTAVSGYGGELEQRLALIAWLRQGERLAQAETLPIFNPDRFMRNVSVIRDLVAGGVPGGYAGVMTLCQDAGVGLHALHELPKAAVGGATFWLREHPAILLPLRHATEEHFWLMFFEHAHRVVHGPKCGTYISSPAPGTHPAASDDSVRHAFSAIWDGGQWAGFLERRHFSREDVEAVAEVLRVTVGMVVARLQREGHLRNNSRLNSLKSRVLLPESRLGGS